MHTLLEKYLSKKLSNKPQELVTKISFLYSLKHHSENDKSKAAYLEFLRVVILVAIIVDDL